MTEERPLSDMMKEILDRLDRIEQEVLANRSNYPTVSPSIPPIADGSVRCSKCGMVWKGVMGYVCSNQPCPVQPSPWYGGNTWGPNAE
jgi:hypothetical protein